MATKFSELTKDFTPERRERIEAAKALLRAEMELAELRQAMQLTQSTLAEPCAGSFRRWAATLKSAPSSPTAP